MPQCLQRGRSRRPRPGHGPRSRARYLYLRGFRSWHRGRCFSRRCGDGQHRQRNSSRSRGGLPPTSPIPFRPSRLGRSPPTGPETRAKEPIASTSEHSHWEITLIDPVACGPSIRTNSRSPVKSIVPVKMPSRSVRGAPVQPFPGSVEFSVLVGVKATSNRPSRPKRTFSPPSVASPGTS